MQIIIVKTYTDQEDEEISRTSFDLRPDLPILVTTDKGTTQIAQPSDVNPEFTLRLPVVSPDTESASA